MTKPVKDFAASARARLLDVTHARNGNFQLTLQRYVAERFLYPPREVPRLCRIRANLLVDF
jgi:hypothetical protein